MCRAMFRNTLGGWTGKTVAAAQADERDTVEVSVSRSTIAGIR